MAKPKWSLHSVAQFIGAAGTVASTYVPAAIAGQDWVACATGTATATATATLTSGQRMVDAIACRQHTCVLGTTCVMCAPPYGRRNNRTSSAGSAYRSRPSAIPAIPAHPQVKQLRWRRPYVSFYIRCGVNKQTVFVYGYSSLSRSYSYSCSSCFFVCALSIRLLLCVLLIMAYGLLCPEATLES